MDQRCATRDQRGNPSGVDFVTQPTRRDAKQAGRSVQRHWFRWVLNFIHARNSSDGSALKPQPFRIQSCGLEDFRASDRQCSGSGSEIFRQSVAAVFCPKTLHRKPCISISPISDDDQIFPIDRFPLPPLKPPHLPCVAVAVRVPGASADSNLYLSDLSSTLTVVFTTPNHANRGYGDRGGSRARERATAIFFPQSAKRAPPPGALRFCGPRPARSDRVPTPQDAEERETEK